MPGCFTPAKQGANSHKEHEDEHDWPAGPVEKTAVYNYPRPSQCLNYFWQHCSGEDNKYEKCQDDIGKKESAFSRNVRCGSLLSL